jgi:chromosome segregation ATPase
MPASESSGFAERPTARLEVRHGSGQPTEHRIGEAGFLLGSVPGCDLRLPGVNLPPVVALLCHTPEGLFLRKLTPVAGLLHNGRPASSSLLADGDRLTLGAVDLLVRLPQETPSPLVGEGLSEGNEPPTFRVRLVDPVAEAQTAPEGTERERRLHEQIQELETDRILWYRRRQEIEQECQRQEEAAESLRAWIEQERGAIDRERAELEQRSGDLRQREEALQQRGAEIQEQEQHLEQMRQDLLESREQLRERYRRRRDELAGMQESLRRAAENLQERKRQFEAQLEAATESLGQETTRRTELETLANELHEERRLLDDARRLFNEEQQEMQRQLGQRLLALDTREEEVEEREELLARHQAQHQQDLVRLDRLAGLIETRQKQMQERAIEVDRGFERLQHDSREMEEQARQLDTWHSELSEQARQNEELRLQLETTRSELSQRSSALEGQQVMLATLRTRLERLREEQRREDQQSAERRDELETLETDLRHRLEEVQRLRVELDGERLLYDQEQRRFEERRSTIDAAVTQLRQTQEKLALDAEELRRREEQVNAVAAEQVEQAALLRARSTQVEELRQRLEGERQALRDRETALAQAEQAVGSLQEQLRRRSEDLNQRQRALGEQTQQHEETRRQIESGKEELDLLRQRLEDEAAQNRQQLAQRALELESLQQQISERERNLGLQLEQLQLDGRVLDGMRETLQGDRLRIESEQQSAASIEEQRQRDLASLRDEIQGLVQQVPELETRMGTALERLSQARDQLREHLTELHQYARQSREDLEALARQVQTERDGLRQQEQSLYQQREEHRLAVAAFRQQLLEWQGQVGEMKQALLQNESLLQRRQAEIAEQARQVDEATARLTAQAEMVQEQERAVVVRRTEIDRHLTDMREWYRRKLRELAGMPTAQSEALRLAEGLDGPERRGVSPPVSAPTGDLTVRRSGEEGEEYTPPRAASVVQLFGVEPADRQLGELLCSLELVDGDTLQALLNEARRQRRSLRQLLLAGNYLTLYQMALIEAGNLHGLVLGPVRVIDRLHAGMRETVYRVFDPRRNQEALLRHLAEAEMEDAVRPDEFRQRFGAASLVQHPHLAATYEVLEVEDRPAVLQEWLHGVPSTEWPSLAAAPGVWYRLLNQTALGLHAAHQAGLTHGSLHAGQVLLTGEGIVKLCGFGEPPWLAMLPEGEPFDDSISGDLAALGRLAATWLVPDPERKGPRPKPLPVALQGVLRRLVAESEVERYPSAAALLEELERAGSDAPANTTAWERLLQAVREQGDVPLRRSA